MWSLTGNGTWNVFQLNVQLLIEFSEQVEDSFYVKVLFCFTAFDFIPPQNALKDTENLTRYTGLAEKRSIQDLADLAPFFLGNCSIQDKTASFGAKLYKLHACVYIKVDRLRNTKEGSKYILIIK